MRGGGLKPEKTSGGGGGGGGGGVWPGKSFQHQ